MAIDDRIYLSPSHNSIMTWGMNNHTPASSATIQTHDTLGRLKTMDYRRWHWLIGLTDASDQRLLEWAQSFRTPPSLELQGAKLDLDSYVAERRAVRLIVESSTPVITLEAYRALHQSGVRTDRRAKKPGQCRVGQPFAEAHGIRLGWADALDQR